MADGSLFNRLAAELGIRSVLSSPRDAKILFIQRFIRLFAYGASTLILTLFLSGLGVSDERIGLFMTLTLLGDVVISFFLTLFADGLGRRRILVVGSALMAGSGVVFAITGNYWVLVAASIFGVITPSGNEIGPFRAIEESTLAQLTPKEVRSDIFAWYTLLGTAGAAGGTIVCGWCVQALQTLDGWTAMKAYRAVFGVYAFLGLVKLSLSLLLSRNCEAETEIPAKQQDEVEMDNVEVERLLSDNEEEDGDPAADAKQSIPLKSNPQPPIQPASKASSIWPKISIESRSILWKLCILFALDSAASGLIPPSWIIYFFNRKFGMSDGSLGSLFFTTNIVASASNLVASSLAKRIGLVKTMVFTHLPSAICLALIPVPSAIWLAITFLILRSSTSSMDQAPRQAFLAAVVLPGERTAVMGVVNVVKTLSQSAGPVITGWLAGAGKFWIAFVAAGAMKATYDLAMLKLFLGHQTLS